MKKMTMMALLIVLTAPAAHAATAAKATATAPASANAAFPQEKQKAIAHAGEKITDWQKRQACAQAATDETTLKACSPSHGKKKS